MNKKQIFFVILIYILNVYNLIRAIELMKDNLIIGILLCITSIGVMVMYPIGLYLIKRNSKYMKEQINKLRELSNNLTNGKEDGKK